MREKRDYQENRNIIKFKDYQLDFLNDNSKVVIGNMPRGAGKTFLLINKVLRDKPKTVLFVDNYSMKFNVVSEKLKEIFNFDETVKEQIDVFINKREYIKIEFTNGDYIKIYNYSLNKNNLKEQYDMIIFNDCLPQLDIKSNKYVSTLTLPLYKIIDYKNKHNEYSYHFVGIKDLIDSDIWSVNDVNEFKQNYNQSAFRSEIDILNEYDNIFNKNITKESFIEQSVQSLMKEYLSIVPSEKNTMRRKDIINMIEQLNRLNDDKINNSINNVKLDCGTRLNINENNFIITKIKKNEKNDIYEIILSEENDFIKQHGC